MKQGKRASVRSLCIFLAALLALTFLSRTLYHATLPHVTAVRVSGGYLSGDFSAETPELRAQTTGTVVPCAQALEDALPVSAVYVRKNQAVQAGEPLLQFEEHWGEYALSQARLARDTARASLSDWQCGYEEALSALDANDPAQAAQRRLLEQEKVCGGVSLAEVSARCEAAEEAFEALSRLEENGWQLRAPEDLWVTELKLQAGDQYRGVEPALHYIAQSETVYAGVSASRQLAEQAARVSVCGSDGKTLSAWRFDHAEIEGERCTLWAVLADPSAPKIPAGGLTFHLETDYFDALVPRAALCGNSIYLVRQRAGSWGQSEEYAYRVEGSYTLQDDQYALFVADEPLAGEEVLIDWDRAFEEGDTLYVRVG